MSTESTVSTSARMAGHFNHVIKRQKVFIVVQVKCSKVYNKPRVINLNQPRNFKINQLKIW